MSLFRSRRTRIIAASLCLLVALVLLARSYLQRPPAWCPEKGDVFVTVKDGGGFCNHVWEYISVWAVARRYGLKPLVQRAVLEKLAPVFTDLHVPALEHVADTCHDMSWLYTAYVSVTVVKNQTILMEKLEKKHPDIIIKLRQFLVLTEVVVPLWREIPEQMTLRSELRAHAQRKLQQVRDQYRQRIIKKTGFDPDLSGLQLVGVHVRRTDYSDHVIRIYPGARVATPDYFKHAMRWMRAQLHPSPVAFVVASDDLAWCRQHLRGVDVFIAGNGNWSLRGEDLALLGACHHSIITYGTFGLTAAMLAQGQWTLVYDTQNGTYSKEMEFINVLPGWHAMDDEGNLIDPKVTFIPTYLNDKSGDLT